jgi:hypothetical protein
MYGMQMLAEMKRSNVFMTLGLVILDGVRAVGTIVSSFLACIYL